MSPFEAIKHEEDGIEYWSARELAVVLGYTEYGKFKRTIERAEKACEGSGYAISDHFAHVSDMVRIGSGAQREVEDIHLSRYACYLIVQNADPEKPIVALGQTYFASQTRLQELTDDQRRIEMREAVTEHGKLLNAAASEVGVVTARDFATFTDHGYMGLYAGEKARDIHARKGLKKGQHILDWMGYEELADNMFRQVQAEGRIRREGAVDRDDANRIHREVGKKVRQTIAEMGGTMPGDWPTTTESVQQLRAREQRRLEAEQQPSLWSEEP
jgi:DNA-damage-inducible protein D